MRQGKALHLFREKVYAPNMPSFDPLLFLYTFFIVPGE
jgi:hypothetical protein